MFFSVLLRHDLLFFFGDTFFLRTVSHGMPTPVVVLVPEVFGDLVKLVLLE